MERLLDSHAHLLSEEMAENFSEVIANAKEVGINRILVICSTIDEAKKALELKKTEDIIDIAVGYDHSTVDNLTENDWNELEDVIKNPNIVAIGEIGLDLYWRQDNFDLQKEAFIRQINLANKYDKPIIIHSREAIMDTLEILKTHPVNRTGVMHCYSSSVEMAVELIKIGYYISLAGPVTFKNARVPKEVAKTVPIERLLIETDSPYLTPEPYRGKRNEPKYIPYIADMLCELREIEKSELSKALFENYENLFYGK